MRWKPEKLSSSFRNQWLSTSTPISNDRRGLFGESLWAKTRRFCYGRRGDIRVAAFITTRLVLFLNRGTSPRCGLQNLREVSRS
jgi:hypothetical protein